MGKSPKSPAVLTGMSIEKRGKLREEHVGGGRISGNKLNNKDAGDGKLLGSGRGTSGSKILSQVGKSKKRFSAIEKRDYVLTHVGIQEPGEMAEYLHCTEDWIYRILSKIRQERDLLHGRLIENVAEEQFNRLNASARTAFKELMAYRKSMQDEEADGKALYRMHKIYRDAEHALTYFLRAVGLYRDDRPVVATQINVNIGKKGIGEILEELRQEYDNNTIDIIAKNVEAKEKRNNGP